MNELTILEKIDPVAVYNGGLDNVLGKISEEVKSVVLDVTTDAGRKDIASIAYKVARSKTLIDDMGKKLGEEAKVKLDAINADRRKARDFLDNLKEEVRKPLTDFENKEKDRVAKHEANIAEIVCGGQYSIDGWISISVEAMKDRKNEILSKKNAEWEEFNSKANFAINEAVKKIDEAISKKMAYDKEQDELDELRKKEEERKRSERDEQIRKETEDRVKREEEAKAERAKLESEKLLKEAEEKAQRAQEEAKKAAEAEKAKFEAAKREEEEATKRREEDKKHRDKINNEAMLAIGGLPNMNNGVAKVIVEAIAKGQVPNVKITY